MSDVRGGSPPTHSTQQLVDLVLNPRDAGYEAAYQRRGGRPVRQWYDQPLIALGAGVAGFILAIAYVFTNRGAPQAAVVHSRLVSRVQAAEQHDNGLAGQAQRLNRQLNTLREDALGGSALAGQLTRAQLQAGQIAVTGPGLQVVLTEPPVAAASPTPGNGGTGVGDANILTDRDVRSVVNQLWADGAEAVAVNGVRLTPTSAIRLAGQAILVDFQPITSPFTVQAIGDAAGLDTGFAASAVASRYQTLHSADDIGFSFGERGHLSLRASPAQSLRYARPVRGTR
jgi:uncharacterized protein YlxW (UPF0749 family)